MRPNTSLPENLARLGGFDDMVLTYIIIMIIINPYDDNDGLVVPRVGLEPNHPYG